MKCPECAMPTTVGLSVPRGDGYVIERHRSCPMNHCTVTFEISGMDKTITKHAMREGRLWGFTGRAMRFWRNREIRELLLQGNKHEVIAQEMGLANNMVTHLAKGFGIKSVHRKPFAGRTRAL